MTQYERSGPGQPWRDDPAAQLVDELYHDISEELGTEGPVETFGHPREARVGHLMEDDEGFRPDLTSDVIAYDTHDTEDLAAEELAMHYVEPDGGPYSSMGDELVGLPEDLRGARDLD